MLLLRERAERQSIGSLARRVAKMNAELDLSLEIVILLVLAIFMLVFGVLLFPIQTGALQYNADATYGLFQVIVSFQIITLGKTRSEISAGPG